jgi:hypothetical protein
VESKRCRPVLLYALYAGNRYNQKVVNKTSTTRWTCANRTYSDSVTTDSSNTVIHEYHHSCIPDLAATFVSSCLRSVDNYSHPRNLIGNAWLNWMNIKNILFEKQCTHFSLKTEFLQLMLCTGKYKTMKKFRTSVVLGFLHELKFK